MKDLTKGNITKLLFAFAIPVLIGCILQLTYSLVDTRIVGSALGESALAAEQSFDRLFTGTHQRFCRHRRAVLRRAGF